MRKLPLPNIATSDSAYAFLLGLIFNQNIKAEKAWKAPEILFERLNSRSVEFIASLDTERVEEAIRLSPCIHPFAYQMSNRIVKCSGLLLSKYDSDARNIWTPSIDAKGLMNRLVEFDGIGQHKAIVGLFLLTVELGVTVWDDSTKISVAKECPSLAQIYAPFDSPNLTLRCTQS